MSYPSLLEVIKEFFHEYDDLRFYMLQSISKLCKNKKKTKKSKELDRFVLNTFQLLHKISNPKKTENFYVHDPEKLTLLTNRKKKTPESFSQMYKSAGKKRNRSEKDLQDEDEELNELTIIFNEEEHGKIFQNAWRELIHLPLNSLVYKQILLDMPQYILPFFPQPELFSDFFTDAYNLGGMSSILALQGLFVLISQYNLEYKDFYKHLYSMLQPSLFLVKYSGKFFELCRVFFASYYLPEYLCAAFCKRLIRLGLKAPPTTYLPVLALVHNIIASNQQLAVLLHRPTSKLKYFLFFKH